jgi:DNA-binding NtrC family response regulator
MILVDGDLIGEEHLPPDMRPHAGEQAALRLPLGLELREVEREYLLASLERNGGNKARPAEGLGISEKTLYNKLHRYAARAQARAGGPGEERDDGGEGAEGGEAGGWSGKG